MTCREISEFLLEYTSGELDVAVRAEFEQHIADCGHCHEFLRQYRATISAGQAAFRGPDAEFSGDLPEELIAAILAALEDTP